VPSLRPLDPLFHPWLIGRSIDEGGGAMVVAIRKDTVWEINDQSMWEG